MYMIPADQFDNSLRNLFSTASGRTGGSWNFSAAAGTAEQVQESIDYFAAALQRIGFEPSEFTLGMTAVEGREGRFTLDKPKLHPHAAATQKQADDRTQKLLLNFGLDYERESKNGGPSWTQRVANRSSDISLSA